MNYADYLTALRGDATTANDTTALANIPNGTGALPAAGQNAPVPGAGNPLIINRANAVRLAFGPSPPSVTTPIFRATARPNWFASTRLRAATTVISGGTQLPFPYSAEHLVGLLNALYEVHFFDMPSRYAAHAAAQLAADGTVSMAGVDSANAAGNGVCVRMASLEACVRWGNRAPVALDRIAQRAFGEAQRLAAGR